MHKYKLFHLITWLVSIMLAAWVLSALPVSSIFQSASQLSLLQWLAWIALNVVIILVYVQRWMSLAVPAGVKINFMQLFMVRQAGQAVSFITPGPQFGGEPLQVVWLWKTHSNPGDRAFLAVVLDRFYELWINFAVLFIGILVLLLTPAVQLTDFSHIALALIFMILLLSFLGWFLLFKGHRIAAWMQRLASRWQDHPYLSRLDAHWESISTRLSELIKHHRVSLTFALLLSILGWIGMILELWLLLQFFDIQTTASGFILLFVAMRLAFLLPLPGGVGTLEAAVFWVFTGLELPQTGAVALLAMMRLRDAVVLSIGMIALRILQSEESSASVQ
jgi:uncharacterized protein (TIRG00374 family)